MKTKLKQLSMICAISTVAFLSSCKDDVVVATPASSDSFTATVNGVVFTSTSTECILEKNTDAGIQTMVVYGIAGNETYLDIGAYELLKTDAFVVGSNPAIFVDFGSKDEELYSEDPQSGALKITAHDVASKTISGTFEFRGLDEDTGKLINVTNGVFTNLKYVVEYE